MEMVSLIAKNKRFTICCALKKFKYDLRCRIIYDIIYAGRLGEIYRERHEPSQKLMAMSEKDASNSVDYFGS